MKINVLSLLIVVLMAAPNCGADTQEAIKAAIEDANQCDTTDECTVVDFGCPFGCGSYVNRDHAAGLKQRVEDFKMGQNSACEYQCVKPGEPVCEKNKCVAPATPASGQ